jgi:predicted membrane-bound spermidine synthase
MSFYTPDTSQIGGSTIAVLYTILTVPYLNVVITAFISGIVGFIATTIARYLWEKIKERWSKR